MPQKHLGVIAIFMLMTLSVVAGGPISTKTNTTVSARTNYPSHTNWFRTLPPPGYSKTFMESSVDQFGDRYDRSLRTKVISTRLSHFEDVGLLPDDGEKIGRNMGLRAAKNTAREGLVQIPVVIRSLTKVDDTVDRYVVEPLSHVPILKIFFKNEGSFVSKMVTNTIAGTDEKSMNLASPTPQPTEKSFLERLVNDNTDYGIEPRFSSPYVHFAKSITRDGEEMLRFDMRYYYERFREHEFKILFSVPLDTKWRFNTGVVFAPNEHDREMKREYYITTRLERQIDKAGRETFFMGMRTGHRTRFVAGLNRTF